MLTSCGGMLSDFLNVIPEEFHTAIIKNLTTILLGSFIPFRLLSFVLLLPYYMNYSFFFFSCSCEVTFLTSLI